MSALPGQGHFFASTTDVARSKAPSSGAPVWQRRGAWVGLAVLLVFLGARFTILVQPRAMEFDQISTVLTAEAPSWHAYLAAVPADSQPPFSHVAARLGLLLPLPQAVGVHAVSALAMMMAVLCLFLLFERRGAPLAGLCSAALLTASRGVEFMFTIRPYAALMAVSAASLLFYDTYRNRRAAGIRTSLWPLALTIVFAATIHALSLLYTLVPIVAGELLYWYRTRRADKRLLLAVALSATAFGFDFILAHQIQARYMSLVPMSARTPGLPTLAKLLEVLAIPVERRWQAILLAVVAGLSLLMKRRSAGQQWAENEAGRDLEFPLLAALALYAAAVLAFAAGAANHYFFPRYASPTYLCAPLLLGVGLAAAAWRRLPAVQFGIAVLLIVLPLSALRRFLKEDPRVSPTEANAAIFTHDEVIASPLAFPTLWWYARPEERKRLRMITDADGYRTIPDGIPEVVLQRFVVAGVLPFALTEYRDYKPGHDVYLVAPVMSGDTWVPAALQARGYTCSRDASVLSQTYAMTHCVRSESGADERFR